MGRAEHNSRRLKMVTLQNVSVVILQKTDNNGLKASEIIENPRVLTSSGQPLIGPNMRRVLTVKEIVAKTGLSKNKAAIERRINTLNYLADFPGQSPIPGLTIEKAA
jgi:hypothetical protein